MNGKCQIKIPTFFTTLTFKVINPMFIPHLHVERSIVQIFWKSQAFSFSGWKIQSVNDQLTSRQLDFSLHDCKRTCARLEVIWFEEQICCDIFTWKWNAGIQAQQCWIIMLSTDRSTFEWWLSWNLSQIISLLAPTQGLSIKSVVSDN